MNQLLRSLEGLGLYRPVRRTWPGPRANYPLYCGRKLSQGTISSTRDSRSNQTRRCRENMGSDWWRRTGNFAILAQTLRNIKTIGEFTEAA